MRVATSVLLAALAACATGEPEETAAIAPRSQAIEVMVLGTYHFAGSAGDLISFEPDDVRAPARQEELARIAQALAAFKPTVIAVERETAPPDYRDPKFAEFTDAELLETKNERAQIGYRLARVAGVDRVYGIDEQPSEGEPDYFPFNKLAEHAAKTGQGAALAALLDSAKTMIEGAASRMAAMSVAEALIEANEGLLARPDFYYEIGKFDVGEEQPGAELQAYWFMRNAKIFSKLMDVANPGDRVIVVYGAGHKFWLEHMVEHTPGFIRVDPTPYLREALR